MRKLRWKVYATMVIVMVLLNVVAWSNVAFCDWYIVHIFPLWINTYGRLTGLFPFAIGEIMLITGIVLIGVALLVGIALLIRIAVNTITHKNYGNKFYFISKKFYSFFAWIALGVCFVMTLNCFILYHASSLSEKYFRETKESYSLDELIVLRNYIVEKCNELSFQMERDENDYIIYNGDMKSEAIASMQNLGETYGLLSGYYVRPKPQLFSDFFSQQYMAGYYLPFAMEATYNDVMYIMNKPSTFCHELAHIKGFIYEDEANFIAYLACLGSEDIVFQYSGYLSVLYYVDNDLYRATRENPELYTKEVRILPQVYLDNIFLTSEEWKRIEEKALFDTEVVDAVSDSFTNTSLKLNGVSDGMISYSRVVKLLLQYYDTKMYEKSPANVLTSDS